jgi:membrane protease YdiL (CAAX protease family)
VTWKRRLAAVFEVFGVYLAGGVLVTLAIRLLGLPIRNPRLLESLTTRISNSELVALTMKLLGLLALQYAGYFALAGPIDWWHRRRGPSAYGLTRASHSWTALIGADVATVVIAGWPALIVSLANARWHLGDTVPWREALFDMSWQRWQFWLFSAVGSWAVIPVVEELFFRGYCQRRLAEDWGDGPAIIGAACLFAFSHDQYFRADPYNIGMIFSVFALGLGQGVVFAFTRSLVPSIFAHAVGDIPMRPPWQLALLAVSIIGWAFGVRPAWAAMKKVFTGASVLACLVLAVLCIAYPIVSNVVPALALVAVGMVLAAVALERTDKRRVGSARPQAEIA